MCGIFASIGIGGGEREIDLLEHRGPDGRGRREFATAAGPLVLGHRRLAIIDPQSRSDQPMATPDGRLQIILNGEIYNYQALRSELVARGYQFHTSSDTEVLLLGYREWGHDVLERLVGMFAFVIADFDQRKLFIARDRFGIKPLYCAADHGRFACASEIKALLPLPFVRRRAESQMVLDFLRFGIFEHDGRTLFQDVSVIRHGHWFEVSLDTAEVGPARRYWKPAWRAFEDGPEQAAAELRRRFDESLRLHLTSDVPVGATLSGGIDSTTIVTSIMRELPADMRLPTYSFISSEDSASEEKWVDLVAVQGRFDCHKVRTDFDEFEREIDLLIAGQDIPLQGPSIYAEYKVFELVKSTGIKVVLGGQGVDELFGGYLPYMLVKIVSLLRTGRLAAACRLAAIYAARTNTPVASLLVQLVALNSGAGSAALTRARLPAWLDRAWIDRSGAELHSPWRSRGRNALRETLLHDALDGALQAHLRYEDHNSMMHGIESRVPFVESRIAELAFAVPEDDLIALDGTTKAVVRRAFADRLPAAIVARKDKIGFAAPDRAWFAKFAPSIEAHLEKAPAQIGPVDTRALNAAWQAMARGRVPLDTRLWRVYFFVRWSQLLNVDIAA